SAASGSTGAAAGWACAMPAGTGDVAAAGGATLDARGGGSSRGGGPDEGMPDAGAGVGAAGGSSAALERTRATGGGGLRDSIWYQTKPAAPMARKTSTM